MMNKIQLVNIRRDDGIVHSCLDKLAGRIGVTWGIERTDLDRREGFDGRIVLNGRPPVRLLVIARRNRRLVREQVHHVVLAARALADRFPQRAILLAPWIEDSLAQELREAGIFYADLEGNMYLDLERPRIHLEIAGRRPSAPLKSDPGRLIEASGLKVLHRLLTQPETPLNTYRRLAEESGVALGTVGVVMRELRIAGHLRKDKGDRWTLHDRAALVDLFVRGYALKLRPACLLGRYRHREQRADRLRDALAARLARAGLPYALTGASAAEVLTRHLHADAVALYVTTAGLDALKNEPMLVDGDHGQLVLLNRFAPTVDDPQKAPGRALRLATPLLVYAELLRDGRPREVETARLLLRRIVGGEREDG